MKKKRGLAEVESEEGSKSPVREDNRRNKKSARKTSAKEDKI